jgi:hypothetical protein
MRLTVHLRFTRVFALTLVLFGTGMARAAPKSKSAPTSDSGKRSGKELSTDDRALDKQMDWEAKVLGPNTQKKIDLAKIQRLQAEELARREKLERLEQAEKDRKEREAATAAAAQRNTKAPSTREVPAVQEAPTPPKPVEKHDDAFVDKLLTNKGEKKKVTVSNDEVDQLLNKAKQDKGASIAPGKGGKNKRGDTVDQLLATADSQPSIKTTARKPAESAEPVSAEAAAREATLKAIAAAAAKSREDRDRNRKPVVPDAAMLRTQTATKVTPPSETPKPAPARASWTDPFASDGFAGTPSRGHAKVTTTATSSPPARTSSGVPARNSPSTRPSGNDAWQDPFDSGGRAKPRVVPPKAAPAARPVKHPANWKDPFA